MTRPYILLSTGSFAPPDFYDPFAEEIRSHGYDFKALHLRSVGLAAGQGREGPPPTMYDDAALIASEIEALADAGREVILMAHSYGGIPATESTKGLSVRERQKQGKKGGLVRLAYKTVLLTTPGKSAADVLGPPSPDKPSLYWMDEQGWMHMTDLDLSAALCFSDSPQEEGLQWAQRFSQHSAVSFTNPLTHAGYKDVPVSYLICETDLVIPPEVQRKQIEMIEAETGEKVDVTSIQAGHCPTAVFQAEVVAWLLDVASKS